MVRFVDRDILGPKESCIIYIPDTNIGYKCFIQKVIMGGMFDAKKNKRKT